MKVYIGKYVKYFGSYQLAEKLLFWKKTDDNAVYALGDKLSSITWIHSTLEWLHRQCSRPIYVKIDDYDVWNLDSTLAHIIAPALKKLKDARDGAPYVDNADVPEHLRTLDTPSTKTPYEVDDNFFLRWHWVLDEMIFAFDTARPGGTMDEPEYGTTEYDLHEARKTNGFRLFGKYYQALWT